MAVKKFKRGEALWFDCYIYRPGQEIVTFWRPCTFLFYEDKAAAIQFADGKKMMLTVGQTAACLSRKSPI